MMLQRSVKSREQEPADIVKTPRGSLSKAHQTLRTQLRTLDQRQKSIYKTSDQFSSPGMTQLDPRELYLPKKSMQVASNSIDFKQTTTFFMPRKPAINSVFGSNQNRGAQRQRNNNGQGIQTQVRMSPLKGSPQKLMIQQLNTAQVTPNTSTPGPRKSFISSGGLHNPRLNQTLMSLRNRTQPHYNAELPSLNHPQTTQGHGAFGKESLESNHDYKSRRQTFDSLQQRSIQAPSNKTSRNQGDSTAPKLDRLSRHPFRIDDQGQTVISPIDLSPALMSPLIPPTNGASSIVNKTARNFYKSSEKGKFAQLATIFPKTPAQQQRNMNLLQQAKTGASAGTSAGQNQKQVDFQKRHYTGNSQGSQGSSIYNNRQHERPNSQKIVDHISNQSQSPTKENKLKTPTLAINVARLSMSPEARNNSFSFPQGGAEQQRVKLKIGASSSFVEKQSAVFMIKPSEINAGSERYNYEDLSDRGDDNNLATENSINKDLRSKSPVLGGKPAPMEITRVPAALATKSSKAGQTLVRRTSSKQPLRNSNSYISSSHISNQRSKVKKLASFNNDLVDVVKQSEFSKSKKTSKKHIRAKTDIHVISNQNGDSYEEGYPETIYQNKTEEEVSLVISKETLIPAHKLDANDQSKTHLIHEASSETFKQKMSFNRPPKLEIRTVSRQKKAVIINNNSQPGTPTLEGKQLNIQRVYQQQIDDQVQVMPRKQVSKNGQTFGSNMTLTMSNMDVTKIQNAQSNKQTTTPRKSGRNSQLCQSAFQKQQIFVQEDSQEQVVSPMIIQTNSLAKRAIHLRQEQKVKVQVSARKATLEERTLDKIARLRENNSIIIDCNVLSGDQDNRLQTIQTQQGTTFETQPDEEVNNTGNNSALGRFSQRNQKSLRMSQKKNMSNSSQQKQVVLLGNPLQTSQLLTPRRKPTTQTARQSIEAKPTRENSVLDKNQKKTDFGVGSVVLHLRKQRVNHDGKQVEENFDSLQSGAHDIETTSLGTREMTSRDQVGLVEQKSNDLSQVMPSPRESLNEYATKPNNRHQLNKAQTYMSKNGQVLRQKAFTKIITTTPKEQKTKVISSPRPTQLSQQPKAQQKKQSQRRKQKSMIVNGKLRQLELIGTQKEQVSQLPRMPKYDVQKMRRQQRGGSDQSPPNFFIPHYNYFGGPAVSLQQISGDTFGETLRPGQMHQLITLENGQMMIRRVDVAFTPSDQISINFDQNTLQHSVPQTAGFPTGGSDDQMIRTDYAYSPMQRPGGSTPDGGGAFNAASPVETPQTAELATRKTLVQFLELPAASNNMLQLKNYNKKRTSSIAVETILGTEESYASNLRQEIFEETNGQQAPVTFFKQYHNVQAEPQSAKISQIGGKVSPESSSRMDQCGPGSNSQNDHYKGEQMYQVSRVGHHMNPRRNVTQRISSLVDQNMSGEILLRENVDQQHSLLDEQKYVYNQKFQLTGNSNNHNKQQQEGLDSCGISAFNLIEQQNMQQVGLLEQGYQTQHQNNNNYAATEQDQVSYNYLMSQGLHLQPTDERFSENDESTLEIRHPANERASPINNNKMMKTASQLVPQSKNNVSKAKTIESEPVISFNSSNNQHVLQNNSSPRKLVILNRPNGNSQRLPHNNNKPNEVVYPNQVVYHPSQVQASQQSGEWADHNFRATLQDAKFDEQQQQQDASFDNQVKESVAHVVPVEEDPIILAKKTSPKLPFNSSRDSKNGKGIKRNNDFKPWDDKADAILVAQNEQNQRKNLNKMHASLNSQEKQSPIQSYDSNSKARLVASYNSHSSSVDSIQQSQNSKTRNSKNTTILNHHSSKANKNTSQGQINTVLPQQSRLRVNSKAMIVNDKAKTSVREKQEREMNAIVFDDLNTPHFRHRATAADMDAKVLEEIAKKPLADHLHDNLIEPSQVKSEDDFQNDYDDTYQQTSNLRSIPRDQLTLAQKHALRKSLKSNVSRQEAAAAATVSRSQEAQDAVLTTHEDELQCLRTSDLNFKKPEPDQVRKSTQNHLVEQTELEMELVAKYGNLRRSGWKAPVPEGVDPTYINDSHLESYFKQ